MKKFKEILIKLNNWKFIILIVLIIGGAFYWYQIRPAKIYSNCDKEARDSIKTISGSLHTTSEFKDFYDIKYGSCLRNKGINK